MIGRKSTQDDIPHLLTVIHGEGEKYFEVDHPSECQTETVTLDSLAPECGPIQYEHYVCRVQWVIDNAGLDFLEHPDGKEGWLHLEPGTYPIIGYTNYIADEFGGTYGEEWDTGVMLVQPLPVSDRITMRPVWRRRQRRHYMQSELSPPTEKEISDADLVLSDSENETSAPALWLEATMIKEESNARAT